MNLRAARDGDSAAIVAIVAEAYADYSGCILLVDEEEPELRRPGTAYAAPGGWWVVERGHRIVASVALCSATAQLKKLYVAKAARGKGLGAQLARHAEARARMAGLKALRLWTDTRFVEAHRLYERLGWHRQPMTRLLADASNTTEFEYRKRL
ncbi:MAG TPA: GNAT family N-acetyltransferase [Kiloniellales bacterium]|nr:GNAT family N-acetyltransferase [Kiloniellales bacterium]